MTKIAIKSDKITPFGGIFWVMQQFDRSLSQVIDSTLEGEVQILRISVQLNPALAHVHLLCVI